MDDGPERRSVVSSRQHGLSLVRAREPCVREQEVQCVSFKGAWLDTRVRVEEGFLSISFWGTWSCALCTCSYTDRPG